MEQGVEPIARLIWAPRPSGDAKVARRGSPLREPPISADPMALRQRQSEDTGDTSATTTNNERLDLPADLPPPLVLPEGSPLPGDGQATGNAGTPQGMPPVLEPPPVSNEPPASQAAAIPPGAPPPPLLPPP
jgi:hypothetical protein